MVHADWRGFFQGRLKGAGGTCLTNWLPLNLFRDTILHNTKHAWPIGCWDNTFNLLLKSTLLTCKHILFLDFKGCQGSPGLMVQEKAGIWERLKKNIDASWHTERADSKMWARDMKLLLFKRTLPRSMMVNSDVLLRIQSTHVFSYFELRSPQLSSLKLS